MEGDEIMSKKGSKQIVESEVLKSSQQINEKKQDIKYDTRDYVIRYLKQLFEEENLYVPLDYQRNFIWTEKDKCFFIESVLMGLPIPFMFFSDTEDGRIEIVDGAQRTQTLVEFLQGNLILNELEVLTDSNGFTFNDLDPAVQRKFENTNIRVVFLEDGTSEKVRQEIFKRINTGGKKALPTETRRGSIEGPFMTFLTDCTKNEQFNKLAPRSEQTEKRYEGIELVSRFFAYLDNYEDDFPNYTGNVALYIDKYVEVMNEKWKEDNQSVQYKATFESMLQFVEEYIGNRGFRKKEKSKSTPRARFEAISIGVALAMKQSTELCSSDNSWIDDDEFLAITRSDAANNKSKLKKRIDFVKDKLLGD
jgi:hypothetical protein